MAIKNYSAAAETLIQLSGGKENFITVENCATRVRIQYKDLSKVDKKAIGEMDGVLSVIEKDGLQVVVGPGVCNKLCAAINEILSVDRAASTAAPDAPDVPEEKKKGNFLKIISDIFVPVLPAMIAGGIVQGLNNVLKSVAEARAAAAGIAATETLTAAQVWLQNYHLLNLSNLMGLIYACVFNFLAIYVGYTAAKRLSVDPVLGALIGCITLSGDLTKFGTSAGKGGLIGVIISILVLKYIYKFIQKIIPNQVAVIFVPTLSVLITAALMITILMPVCGVLSDAIVSGLMWILDKTGVFGGFILAACFPTLISTGLHHGLTAIHMEIRITGPLGAVIATLGCITPSLLIVSLLAYIYYRYKNVSALQSVLASLRPAVVALIAGAGLSILKLVVFQGNVVALASVNWAGVLIFVAAFVALRMFKINPILTMLCCGVANLFVNLFC